MDLHIHTALSPCAEDEMRPRRIVMRAVEAGLDVIGIADHNSAENVAAVAEAAKALLFEGKIDRAVYVVPGMEVTTKEEVHVLCMFARAEDALAWQEVVYRALPPEPNDVAALGDQLVLDSADEVIRRANERRLISATSLGLEEVFRGVAEHGGVAIPSHVDRTAYGLLGVLGVIPEEIAPRLVAVEVSGRISVHQAIERHPCLKGIPLIRSSDAHWLSEVGASRTGFVLEGVPSLEEIRLALTGEGGRGIVQFPRRTPGIDAPS